MEQGIARRDWRPAVIGAMAFSRSIPTSHLHPDPLFRLATVACLTYGPTRDTHDTLKLPV